MRDEELAAAEAEKASQVRQPNQLLAVMKEEMDRMDPIVLMVQYQHQRRNEI